MRQLCVGILRARWEQVQKAKWRWVWSKVAAQGKGGGRQQPFIWDLWDLKLHPAASLSLAWCRPIRSRR